MSAEMALEASGVAFRLSGAPLVEGALVAAVEATRPGVTLAEVAAAAERALETKGVTLAVGLPPPAPPAPPAAGAIELTLTITNKVGLHMRPANLFVQTAGHYTCAIRARNLDRPERPAGDAKRLLDIMKLGVSPGHRLHLHADGDDAQAAVDALAQLVAENFGEA
jgi:phosphotransferase system HPr (HPr) family protein